MQILRAVDYICQPFVYLILLDKLEFDYLRLYYCFYNQDNNQ